MGSVTVLYFKPMREAYESGSLPKKGVPSLSLKLKPDDH
jgi:hypothetical protein